MLTGRPVEWAKRTAELATKQLGLPAVSDSQWKWSPYPHEIETDYFHLLAERTGLSLGAVQDRVTRQAVQILEADKLPLEDDRPTRALRSARRSLSPELRQAVIDRDGLVCGICAGVVRIVDIHIDHIQAVANGGRDDIDNLRVTHARCNLLKGRR